MNPMSLYLILAPFSNNFISYSLIVSSEILLHNTHPASKKEACTVKKTMFEIDRNNLAPNRISLTTFGFAPPLSTSEFGRLFYSAKI
jgi:hypothetical protein